MKNRIIYYLVGTITMSLLFFACEDEQKGPVYELEKGKDYVSFISASQAYEVTDENQVSVYIGHANKGMPKAVAKVSILSVGDNMRKICLLWRMMKSFLEKTIG